MSLPSKAYFYREDGSLVGDCFVNVGWSLIVSALERVIFQELPKQVYTDERISYFILYDYKIPMAFVNDLMDLTRDERVKILEKFFKNIDNYIGKT